MSKTVNVIYIETPRHGYIKVDGDDVRARNISQSFSGYSYYDEDNDIFYLEEDCDATMFCKRCELDGVTVVETDEYMDSDEEAEKILSLNDAHGGDVGYFGELEQNHEGLERFFNDEDDDEEDED
jgi:hypothetical protein